MSARPRVGSVMRERILRRVLLPAPFRPMMPMTSPSFTSNETSSSAQNGSRDSDRPLAFVHRFLGRETISSCSVLYGCLTSARAISYDLEIPSTRIAVSGIRDSKGLTCRERTERLCQREEREERGEVLSEFLWNRVHPVWAERFF